MMNEASLLPILWLIDSLYACCGGAVLGRGRSVLPLVQLPAVQFILLAIGRI